VSSLTVVSARLVTCSTTHAVGVCKLLLYNWLAGTRASAQNVFKNKQYPVCVFEVLGLGTRGKGTSCRARVTHKISLKGSRRQYFRELFLLFTTKDCARSPPNKDEEGGGVELQGKGVQFSVTDEANSGAPRAKVKQNLHALSTLATDAARELDVLWHDRDALRVDGAQVRVLKQANQVGLRSLLQQAQRAHTGEHRLITSRVRHSVAIYGQRTLHCDQSMREKAWRSRKRGA
jgi:hypothetical protein